MDSKDVDDNRYQRKDESFDMKMAATDKHSIKDKADNVDRREIKYLSEKRLACTGFDYRHFFSAERGVEQRRVPSRLIVGVFAVWSNDLLN
jgi:hypothetical protein